jgi:hypothetical protein
MQALTFWKRVVMDQSDLIERFFAVLCEQGASFCVIGGVAVNAYAEPLITLDLDLVVAMADLPRVEEALAREFKLRRYSFSLNVTAPGSGLRIQIQLEPRYATFPERAAQRDVLGLRLPVASVEDLLQGKIWAALDPRRRPSKRLKDLLDIDRLVERYSSLRSAVPAELLGLRELLPRPSDAPPA